MDLVISPMRRRHLRSIVRMQAADPHLGWSVGLWIAELRREGDRVYVVAQVGREVVGYGGVLLQGEDAHVTTIGVARPFQHQAIATRMLLHLLQGARERSAHNLTLEVRSSNEAAIALYRRFGMAPAGIRKNYYADLGEDALIMWAHDLEGDAYADRLDAISRLLDERSTPAERREGNDDG